MTFRTKLLFAILGMVAVTTAASLVVAQHQSSASYEALADTLFRQQLRTFQQEQEIRLGLAAQEARRLAGSVRLFAALEANDPEVYKIAADELRLGEFAFFRLVNARGELMAPPAENRAGLPLADAAAARLVPQQTRDTAAVEQVQVGFIPIREGSDMHVFRILASPITNFQIHVGALILGQRIKGLASESIGEPASSDPLQSGFWLGGDMIAEGIPAAVRGALAAALTRAPSQDQGHLELAGDTYRFERFRLNEGSSYPPAYLVSVLSLTPFQSQQRVVALRITLTGLAALLLAAGVGVILSRQLAKPVAELVSATRAIQRGNYAVRVPGSSTQEMNTLAESFNHMAAGLALKDRYHSLLLRVTDPQVAEELIAGNVRLGGERREVTVVFCDIRGYTSMTVGRDPVEVIAILNDHFAALTRIVQTYRGVISQFAGDAIFILFGAPKSYGDDAQRALRCACAMMRERERLNAASPEPLRIGIGIASGPMVAGCIGAETRNDYVVVGERVNLAARLCSAAAAGEILSDAETVTRAGDAVSSAPVGPLSLKGFSAPVAVLRILDIVESPA